MPTSEIEFDNLREFCDEFTRSHQENAVRIEVDSSDLGAQETVRSAPFLGISYEEKGSEKGDITILVGTEPDNLTETRINNVTHVWSRAEENEGHDALEVEDDSGNKIILQLLSSATGVH